jgi:hypothetical protein
MELADAAACPAATIGNETNNNEVATPMATLRTTCFDDRAALTNATSDWRFATVTPHPFPWPEATSPASPWFLLLVAAVAVGNRHRLK